MRYSNDETVEVDLHVHAESQKAMLLSTNGDEKRAEWTPKSQITHIGASKGESGSFEMKEWIAKKNGFI